MSEIIAFLLGALCAGGFSVGLAYRMNNKIADTQLKIYDALNRWADLYDDLPCAIRGKESKNV